MSTNIYQRLRSILPSSTTQIAEVMSISVDGTSTMRLPTGIGQEVYATGVSVGSTFTARGTSVPVGSFAYVRDGIVQSQAPAGVVSDVVIGTVAAQPFGPSRLAAANPTPALQAGQVGVQYSNSLTGAFKGGYPPLVYALANGSLPPGIFLATATGSLNGLPTTVGSSTFAIRCTDATRRAITAAPMILAIAT